jgi:beta-lactamase regulating signal transducer with metallopeptidase domain
MHEAWMGELIAIASGGLMHYLAHSAVTLAILGAVAWLGDRLLRNTGPLAQHRMWVFAFLAGVGMPLLPVRWLSGFGVRAPGAAHGTATVTYSMIAAEAGRWTISPLLSHLLAGTYLLTVLFCVARLVWRWGRTAAMARRSALLPLKAPGRMLVESAARRLGVAPPAVACSTETHGPVVLRSRRPMLLVPEGFFAAERLAPDYQDDLAAALTHECAHVARLDYAKNLLYECVAAVVAYHPASWVMRRRIAETRELVCDEMAAGAMGDRPEYAASLLRLATAMAGSAAQPVYASGTQAIGVFDADILEERVMRLTMDVPKVSRARKIAMALVATCALLGGAATAAALSFDVTPQDGAVATGPVHEKVYKVGGDVSAPKLIYSVDAEFSKKAKDAKYQGVSVVSLIVDSHGMPQHIHAIRKLGMGLDEKAIEAVRQYKFDPATRKGKPVAVAISIEVNFRLY